MRFRVHNLIRHFFSAKHQLCRRRREVTLACPSEPGILPGGVFTNRGSLAAPSHKELAETHRNYTRCLPECTKMDPKGNHFFCPITPGVIGQKRWTQRGPKKWHSSMPFWLSNVVNDDMITCICHGNPILHLITSEIAASFYELRPRWYQDGL